MSPAFEHGTILLAEDDPDDRLLVLRALRELRLASNVHVVEDGEQLLDYLHQRKSYSEAQTAPRPDLILLDLNMPRIDGREALREIKSNPGLRQIPVIVLTTFTTSDNLLDVEETYGLGVNAFVTKPFSFSELSDALRVLGDFWFRLVKLPRA